MDNMLEKITTSSELLMLKPQYEAMLETISREMPVLDKATDSFNKSQSQFMDNMLTVSHPTELRNARQILAEITRSKQALAEAYYAIRKKNIAIYQKTKLYEYACEHCSQDAEIYKIEIEELQYQIDTTKRYMEGAIRKIVAYIKQYDRILDKYGKKEFTEEDFENDEERYHIMKVFQQALCSARSRGGVVDEGNHLYAFQIGINGAELQNEITKYLETETYMVQGLKPIEHKMTLLWLDDMYEKFKGSAQKYAEGKGMTLLEHTALCQLNDVNG